MKINEVMTQQELDELNLKQIGKGVATAGLAGALALSSPDASAGSDKSAQSVSGPDSYHWTHPDYKDSSKNAVFQKPMSNDRIYDIAKQMGISGKLNIKKVGYIPVEINGIQVPTKLLTPEEIQQIKTAREAQSWYR